ncbi:GGDEF domain-containing protein [Acetitomaculum ruminis]|nr:sensor domain-containing diguanylate cyclase [Acetitomaculum ruminis]
MNMFYLVVFGISSFVTLPQGTSFISVSLPFIIFYIILFNEDQARGITLLNYIGLAFICQLTSFMRYQLKIKQFSQMVKIENINALLGKESREDSMTGLRNRFALKDDLDCFKGKKVCVLMADIDFFKQFNDTFGHRVGDIVIKEIARTVKEVFEGEYCYRYGGDELMVIVPDATLVYMEDQVALWKKKISEIHIEGVGRKLSCSHGYAFGMVYNMKDLEKIHEEADIELYKAKENRSW